MPTLQTGSPYFSQSYIRNMHLHWIEDERTEFQILRNCVRHPSLPEEGDVFYLFPQRPDLDWNYLYICHLGFCGLLWKFGRSNGNNSLFVPNSVERKPAVLPILNYSIIWQINFSRVWLVGRFNIFRHDWYNYQIGMACISSPPSHSSQSWPLLFNIFPLFEANSGIPACQNTYEVLDVKQNWLSKLHTQHSISWLNNVVFCIKD